MSDEFNGRWEQRWHPLREEWVVVAAHRQNRPWLGERVDGAVVVPRFDADCYFCPGNGRISGQRNPEYAGVYVFDNDHPCVGENAPIDLARPTGIYRNRVADGVSRVISYSPRHDLTLAEMGETAVTEVVATWQKEYQTLSARRGVNHLLMFENKGEAVGVSNPHPHGQIYGTNFVFKTIETEARVCADYLREHGRPLFQDILAAEFEDGARIVCENETAVAFIQIKPLPLVVVQ